MNKEENNLPAPANVEQKKLTDGHWEWRRWLIAFGKTRNKSSKSS